MAPLKNCENQPMTETRQLDPVNRYDTPVDPAQSNHNWLLILRMFLLGIWFNMTFLNNMTRFGRTPQGKFLLLMMIPSLLIKCAFVSIIWNQSSMTDQLLLAASMVLISFGLAAILLEPGTRRET